MILFESVSGLHLNRGKRLLFPDNEVPDSQILAEILGCEVGSLSTKYLGLALSLSLGSKNKARDFWNEVLGKFEKKINNLEGSISIRWG